MTDNEAKLMKLVWKWQVLSHRILEEEVIDSILTERINNLRLEYAQLPEELFSQPKQ